MRVRRESSGPASTSSHEKGWVVVRCSSVETLLMLTIYIIVIIDLARHCGGFSTFRYGWEAFGVRRWI